jgi:hypothetical protein
VAEGAGIEPARPEGLAALAVRCLAARPTLRLIEILWSPRAAPHWILFRFKFNAIEIPGRAGSTLATFRRVEANFGDQAMAEFFWAFSDHREQNLVA